jgi:mRNA interferase HicA
MGLRRAMNGRQVIKILEEHGWRLTRVKGSHFQLSKGERYTTVPVHGSKDLTKGLLAEIEQQTGVKLR